MDCRALIITIAVAMAIILSSSSVVVAVNITYECYPNATLKVENPANFTMVFANNSQSKCTATWSPSNNFVYIVDCGMGDDISISFSYLQLPYMELIGGQEFEFYSINCLQIPKSGVFRQVESAFGVDADVPESSTYPTVGLDSGIYQDPMGIVLETQAFVGTPLFWVMRTPQSKYRFRPVDCWAYAGKGVDETAPNKKILEDGCTLDQRLLTNFLFSITFRHGQLVFKRKAIVYAFRFYPSEYVTMLCKVRVCAYDIARTTTTFCDVDTCNGGGSYRRDVDVFEDGDRHEYTVQTLRIVPEMSDGTSIEAECAWFLLVLLILKLF